MAAKRRKRHKNKISGLVISMCYNEQKSTKIEILTFYESIKLNEIQFYFFIIATDNKQHTTDTSGFVSPHWGHHLFLLAHNPPLFTPLPEAGFA